MNANSDSDRNRAVRLLTHYLDLLACQAGMKWHSDYDVEIAEIVDSIIAAAVTKGRSK